MDDLIQQQEITAEPDEPRKLVQNVDSGVVHEVLIDAHVDVPPEACRKVCGWKWAMGKHLKPDAQPSRMCRSCQTRGNDDCSGSESREDGAEKDDEGDFVYV